MNVIGYTQGNSSIEIEIDGVTMFVPDDMSNRHRQEIADWEAQGNTIPPYIEPGPTAQDIWNEKDRRLALGFDYTFNDARGVQRIGTTPSDMVGWDEVSKFAQALINVGQSSTEMTIMTNTGVVQLTAIEWQSIMLAAAAFRQPIWGKSFAIASMNPIPSNFTDDSYWT